MTGEIRNMENATNTPPEMTEIQDLKAQLKNARFSLFLTFLVLILFVACTFQQREIAKQTEKEAYLLSVVVSEYEDLLFLKYHTTPSHLGIDEYRDAWIDNPCYETISQYYEILSKAVDMLEKEAIPDNPNIVGIPGDFIPC